MCVCVSLPPPPAHLSLGQRPGAGPVASSRRSNGKTAKEARRPLHRGLGRAVSFIKGFALGEDTHTHMCVCNKLRLHEVCCEGRSSQPCVFFFSFFFLIPTPHRPRGRRHSRRNPASLHRVDPRKKTKKNKKSSKTRRENVDPRPSCLARLYPSLHSSS